MFCVKMYCYCEVYEKTKLKRCNFFRIEILRGAELFEERVKKVVAVRLEEEKKCSQAMKKQ